MMASSVRGLRPRESVRSVSKGSVNQNQTVIIEASANAKQVAALAYEYWQRRGCPIGSPEVDWLKAEEDLRKPTTAA
jgi:DUF2934 family protein